MSESTASFNKDATAIFTRRLGPILRDLGYPPAVVGQTLSTIGSFLDSDRRSALRALGAFLERSEVGRRWNALLDDERGPFLGRLIAPHAVDTVLDLLSGSGSVARSLASLTGAEVAMVERRGCDAGHVSSGAARDFLELASHPPAAAYDTVLLCTVLHHESEPVPLLDLAARIARRRILLVENCIDVDCPEDYQELVDRIFNESLNRTELPCPGNHRSRDGWLALGSSYGEARAVASVSAAPGVPLSHDVIVIEKSS